MSKLTIPLSGSEMDTLVLGRDSKSEHVITSNLSAAGQVTHMYILNMNQLPGHSKIATHSK